MAKILREFFNTTEELDQFMVGLPEQTFVKIVANGQKIGVFSGAQVLAYRNKLVQVKAGKLTQVINLPVAQESPVLSVAKKNRRRH